MSILNFVAMTAGYCVIIRWTLEVLYAIYCWWRAASPTHPHHPPEGE